MGYKTTSIKLLVGARQAAALELYFFDPAHEGQIVPFRVDGAFLVSDDSEATYQALSAEANACDDYAEGRAKPGMDSEERAEYRKDREALATLASRALRAGVTNV